MVLIFMATTLGPSSAQRAREGEGEGEGESWLLEGASKVRQFSSLAKRGWKFNNFVYAHTKS